MSDVVISRIIIVRQESVFRYDQFVLNIRINMRAKCGVGPMAFIVTLFVQHSVR